MAIIAIEWANILPVEQMIEVLKRFQVRVVIPAHRHSYETFAEVTGHFEAEFPVVQTRSPEIDLSMSKIPGDLTVILIEPKYFPF